MAAMVHSYGHDHTDAPLAHARRMVTYEIEGPGIARKL